jgi:hypothetical protein
MSRKKPRKSDGIPWALVNINGVVIIATMVDRACEAYYIATEGRPVLTRARRPPTGL